MRDYHAACHAMQSGVAIEVARDNPLFGDELLRAIKHLRVGINSAMCDHTALVRLLLRKGLIDEADYLSEIQLEMNREVERYEKLLKEQYGISVKLA